MLAGSLDCLGQAEIEHLHHAVGTQLHIGWLEVAVDDSALVRGVQSVGELSPDGNGLRDG